MLLHVTVYMEAVLDKMICKHVVNLLHVSAFSATYIAFPVYDFSCEQFLSAGELQI
jgi:hypothetical protein